MLKNVPGSSNFTRPAFGNINNASLRGSVNGPLNRILGPTFPIPHQQSSEPRDFPGSIPNQLILSPYRPPVGQQNPNNEIPGFSNTSLLQSPVDKEGLARDVAPLYLDFGIHEDHVGNLISMWAQKTRPFQARVSDPAYGEGLVQIMRQDTDVEEVTRSMLPFPALFWQAERYPRNRFDSFASFKHYFFPRVIYLEGRNREGTELWSRSGERSLTTGVQAPATPSWTWSSCDFRFVKLP